MFHPQIIQNVHNYKAKLEQERLSMTNAISNSTHF